MFGFKQKVGRCSALKPDAGNAVMIGLEQQLLLASIVQINTLKKSRRDASFG